ncbi:MAG: Ldh family oxidoreductase [Bacteroidia bacterium]|nr:Ldh family oxidoreductase [Bacteroidia bacterium]MCF8427262.1 Ldh family oxidoreductase [Bacteroidia bacterium]MCF8445978.1 Ldh family oxidoreductase [Bacteroidia bacterium]
MNYSKERLLQFTKSVFLSCGMPEADANLAADVLLSADMRGIDSHGVARLSGYIRLQEAGRANMNAKHKVIHETPSTATVDADQGLGLVVAPKAMDIAIEKAKQVGTGWVAIQNSNHFGIAAYHAMKALPHDMIGISMTNASPLVAPTYSKERMLGTNPICMAFPSGSQQPFIVDMATSNAANGKLEIAQRKNKEIPLGWVQTKNGLDSVNANELKDGGSLLPLGGHKGYGLGAAVDILSAVLSGANYGPWVPPFVAFLNPLENLPGNGIGHFLGAMRIDAFRPAEDFKKHMDQWIIRFKQSQRVDENQEVLIPGEPEFRLQKERELEGIPLNPQVEKDLQELAQKFGLNL